MPKLKLDIPDELDQRLQKEARKLGVSVERRALEVLNSSVAPLGNFEPGTLSEGLLALRTFLERIPAVKVLSTSPDAEPIWWVKLKIDINHPLAWNVVRL